jgi:hypothetical protein
MECLRLYNKPKADVHPGHKLTGPKEEEEEDLSHQNLICIKYSFKLHMKVQTCWLPENDHKLK